MKWFYLSIAVAGLSLAACSKNDTATEASEETQISAEQAEQVKEQLAEGTDQTLETRISVAEDFEQDAEKSITKDNYASQLSELEKEINEEVK